ncbi:UDP-galactose transporter 2-like [Pyrus ussuriensis x Pyrus communis]|uniref:UDP-galactose transporter 2-like n=1 Tax=Pyrus ussuriensis x Pyrus communis TaxID=2448454 RepID=A0A5N5F2R8_9ROSA|nr:UDP-galactose transporter 2-like [Pyrus ussuriensis x Pyrus communis]
MQRKRESVDSLSQSNVSISVFNGDEDGVVQFLKRHRIPDVVLLSNSSYFYYLRKSPGLLSIFLFFFSVFVPQIVIRAGVLVYEDQVSSGESGDQVGSI